jgi:hypothetical protein
MANWELKHYRVLTRSQVNGSIHEPGSIVTIKVDTDTWHPGSNLEEVKPEVAVHTEAQKKAGDEAGKAREESMKKREAAEKKAAEVDPAKAQSGVAGETPEARKARLEAIEKETERREAEAVRIRKEALARQEAQV